MLLGVLRAVGWLAPRKQGSCVTQGSRPLALHGLFLCGALYGHSASADCLCSTKQATATLCPPQTCNGAAPPEPPSPLHSFDGESRSPARAVFSMCDFTESALPFLSRALLTCGQCLTYVTAEIAQNTLLNYPPSQALLLPLSLTQRCPPVNAFPRTASRRPLGFTWFTGSQVLTHSLCIFHQWANPRAKAQHVPTSLPAAA